MQLNPIIVREYRARWRGWRAFAIVLGYAVLLALAVGLLYAANLHSYGARTAPVRRMAEIGHNLFLGVTAMQVFGWMLLAPALTATSIAGEREEGMLDLLHMSPLSPGKIVRGKLISALSFIFLVMLAPVPITALSFLMGGVSPGEFSVAALLQIVTALCGATVGLVCSAWCRRASTAMAIAFSIMGVWGVGSALALTVQGTLGTVSFWLEPLRWAAHLVGEVFSRTNPVVAVFAASSFRQNNVWIRGQEIPNWIFTVIFEALVAALLLWSATRALRRPLQEAGEKPESKRHQKPSGAEANEIGEPLASVERARPPRAGSWWEPRWVPSLNFANPVLQREMQRRLRIRKPPRRVMVILYWLAAFAAMLYLWGLVRAVSGGRGERQVFYWIPAFLYLIVVTVAAAAMSATAFPRERESHTWESLRLSLLIPLEVVIGKLVPNLLACLAPTLVFLILLIPCITSWDLPNPARWGPRDGIASVQVLGTLVIYAATIWTYSCLGMLISWWCRRSWIAVTTAISALLLLLIFLPIFVSLSFRLSGDGIISSLFSYIHPFYALASIVDFAFRRGASETLVGNLARYVFVQGALGFVCLLLLLRELMHTMRPAIPWSVRMDS